MEKGWRVILAFVGIFAAGAVTGGLLTLRAVQSRPAPTATVETPAPTVASQNPPTASAPRLTPAPVVVPAPEQLGPQLFRRLTNQLGLTVVQREKIRPIELRATEELNRLRRDSQHSTQVLIDKLEDEIRALLTPGQLAKFDSQVGRQREILQKFLAEQQRKQREQKEKLFPNLNRGGNAMATPPPVTKEQPAAKDQPANAPKPSGGG